MVFRLNFCLETGNFCTLAECTSLTRYFFHIFFRRLTTDIRRHCIRCRGWHPTVWHTPVVCVRQTPRARRRFDHENTVRQPRKIGQTVEIVRLSGRGDRRQYANGNNRQPYGRVQSNTFLHDFWFWVAHDIGVVVYVFR